MVLPRWPIAALREIADEVLGAGADCESRSTPAFEERYTAPSTRQLVKCRVADRSKTQRRSCRRGARQPVSAIAFGTIPAVVPSTPRDHRAWNAESCRIAYTHAARRCTCGELQARRLLAEWTRLVCWSDVITQAHGPPNPRRCLRGESNGDASSPVSADGGGQRAAVEFVT
jgi:hypothetical protein